MNLIKKSLFIVMALVSATVANAQDNSRVPFYMGTISYKSPDALSTLTGIFASKEVETEDKTAIPALEEAIKSAPSKVYRLNVRPEEAPASTTEEAYRLDALLFRVMSGSANSNYTASTKCKLTLTNLKTGKVVKEKSFYMGRAGLQYTSVAQCIADVAIGVDAATEAFLLNFFPVTGTIIQKGVEQDNGKVKDNQCYIDIAENMIAYVGMTLVAYTNDNGKENEIGKIKVKEVEGEDVSMCTITSGKSKIEKAIEAGQTVYVKTVVKEADKLL